MLAAIATDSLRSVDGNRQRANILGAVNQSMPAERLQSEIARKGVVLPYTPIFGQLDIMYIIGSGF